MDDFIRVEHLKKYFKTPGGMLHAVDDISFSIKKGATLGVVGESGCGKSTLGRLILKLLPLTEGKLFFEGRDITDIDKKEIKELRKEMQLIFQDPFSSLNPRMCVFDLIADPLKTYGMRNPAELERTVTGLMDAVGLSSRFTYSYPHELDGGRRQRVGIARALSLSPKFIVCDEPVSALDVSIQAQILNMLQDLQEERGLTYIFITHDLSVVKHISSEIMVMYTGVMVEKSGTDELFDLPLHPYTKGLLSAIPVPDLDFARKNIILKGELSSPIEPGNECRFAARCQYATDECRKRVPVMEEICPNHFVACHNVRQINDLN